MPEEQRNVQKAGALGVRLLTVVGTCVMVLAVSCSNIEFDIRSSLPYGHFFTCFELSNGSLRTCNGTASDKASIAIATVPAFGARSQTIPADITEVEIEEMG